MSNETITNLLERASQVIDDLPNTLISRFIEQDLDRQDYETLEIHVKQAEEIIYQDNFNPEPDDLTDEEIKKIAESAWTGHEAEDVF